MARSFLKSAVIKNVLRGNGRFHSKISRTFSVSATTNSGFSFEMPPELVQIKDMARKFAREEIIPIAAEHDRTYEFPYEVVDKARELGLTTLFIPKEVGGMGMGCMEGCITVEELSYGCAAISQAIGASGLSHVPVARFGTEEQKKKFLGRFLEKTCFSAYCTTEPGAGSDVAGIKTRAEKKGDEYILNGQKMWISNGGIADWYFVLARTDNDPQSSTGKAFTGFLVEGDSKGVTKGKKEMLMGLHCCNTAGVTFEDVRVPKENVVLGEGSGFKVAMASFDITRPSVAAGAIGIAQRALDEASKYALERKTFGVPIAHHQGVAFMIAEMAMETEISRMAMLKAAWDTDNGKLNAYSSAIAKAFASDSANKTVANAVQIFGGNGFSAEYPVEKLMRDAKIYQIFEGTSQIQRVIISRHYLSQVKQGLV